MKNHIQYTRLDEGACTNVNEKAMYLCFDYDKPDRCYSYGLILLSRLYSNHS